MLTGLLAPWGGHGVFPNIYRDMRHPHKYPRAVNTTYVFTVWDLCFDAGHLIIDSLSSTFSKLPWPLLDISCLVAVYVTRLLQTSF